MSSEQVYIVDDDPDVREATSFLVTTAGYPAESFETPEELLNRVARDSAGCLILDVRLPGMNGLELQRELAEREIRMPIIFITGHGDIPMAVEAVNAGALDFLEKPFDNDSLLARVEEAIVADRERRTREAASADIDQRLERLTPRERQVMEGILAGKLNKVIGYELEMSTRTVEVHRGRILDKLGARNAPEMVRLVLAGNRYRDWSPTVDGRGSPGA
ncbi:response regulator transcription factor [Halofilum ochraceum]|uniref:response regulator transcription factor n=1 Tax=Halofilum ochraceum TaxID=1611323 RepID=UPI0008361500|nr:response regulator [Halofilum ochraceum]